jgi:hypothetical protein
MPELEPGIHPGYPEEDYHRLGNKQQGPYVSQSLLKIVRDMTPEHALEWCHNPPEQTEAMQFGDALHKAVLEPDRAKELVVEGLGIDRRSDKNKALHVEFEAKHKGKTILSPAKMEQLEAMVHAAKHHTRLCQFLDAEGLTEVTIVWDDPATGLRCKARLDRLISWQRWPVIFDLKTIAGYTAPRPGQEQGTGGASKTRLQSQVGNFGYDMQAAHYLDGACVLAPLERRFFWGFAEKKAPWAIRCAEAVTSTIEEGRMKCKAAMALWAKCIETDDFPAYGDDILPVTLKRWHLMSDEELDSMEGDEL